MPSFSQQLSNASASELRIICRAITPYNSSNKPPQVLVIQNNDTALINVLTKYGIIDPISKKPTSSDFGEGKKYTSPNGESVSYITPPSLDRLKSSNGDTSVDIAPDSSSGFDGIIGLAILKSNQETIENFDKKVQEGYKNCTILPSVIRDPATGNESNVILEYDPEETARQKQRDPNSQIQYKIITPPVAEIPTNNTPLGAAISGLESGTIVSPIGFCASPMAQLSGNLATLETTKPPAGYSLGFVMGLNAVSIKALNAAGQIGNANFNNFNSGTGNTWGGFLHFGKQKLEGLRSIYNNFNVVKYGIGALSDIMSNEDPSENVSSMLKYIYKEYMFVPGYKKISDFVSFGLVSARNSMAERAAPNNSSTGRGGNIVSAQDREIIKNTDPKKYKEIFGSNSRGAVSSEKTIIARNQASRMRDTRSVGRTSSWIQLLGYGSIYLGLPLLEEGVQERREDRKQQEENDQIRKNAESSGVNQVGVAIQTGGQIMLDNNTLTVTNPTTGNTEEISVPVALPQRPLTITPPLLVDLDDPLANFNTDDPLINIPVSRWPSVEIGGIRAPIAGYGPIAEVSPEEPSELEKAWYSISEFIVDTGNSILEYMEEVPANFQLQWLLDSVQNTPSTLSKLFGLDDIRKYLDDFFKVGETVAPKLTAIGEFLSSAPMLAFTIFLTEPVAIGDSTVLGSMEKELKKLEDEVRRMSPSDTPSIRSERLKRIDLLKRLIKIEEDSQKRIRENKDLHSPSSDITLNSNTQLFMEVSVAKTRYENAKSLIDSLSTIGTQLSSGTSPVPNVSLSDINQNVSFVTAPDQASPENPWRVPNPYLNTPFNTEGCFPPYIGVLTENGYKKILDFKIGDSIISFNKNGVLENDTVSEIFTHEKCDIYRYYFNNENFIDITKEHPVLIGSNKFKNIGDLQIGDSIINIDGDPITIVKIEFLYNGTVYNLEVKNNHTYISDGIRVHNKLSGPYKQLEARENMRKILIIIEEEERRLYELWLRDQFSESLRDNGDPNIQDYGTVPGTPGDPDATGAGGGGTTQGGGGTPQEGPPDPYSGPPQGNPVNEDGPIASTRF